MKSYPFGSRILVYFVIMISAICVFRSLMVSADTGANSDLGDDIEEVYDSVEDDAGTVNNSRSSTVDSLRADIRLTRPDEADSRVAENDGYSYVPGADRIMTPNNNRAIADLRVPLSTRPGYDIKNMKATSTPTVARSIASLEKSPEAIQIQNSGLPTTPSSLLTNTSSTHPKPIGTTAIQEFSVIVTDYGFFPSRLFVNKGVPVKFYLSASSQTTLCFILDQWGLKKGVVPGKVEEVSFVPEQVGSFRFYCPVKAIEGMLTVRELPAITDSRAPASIPATPNPLERKTSYNEPVNAPQLRALIGD